MEESMKTVALEVGVMAAFLDHYFGSGREFPIATIKSLEVSVDRIKQVLQDARLSLV